MSGASAVFLVFVAILAVHYRLDIVVWLEAEDFSLNQKSDFPLGESLVETRRGLAIPGINVSLINCVDRSSVTQNRLLGEGWNKKVYEFENNALKVANLDGHAFAVCRQKFRRDDQHCILQLRESFLREVLWLSRMRNDPNVPKLISYCADEDRFSILISKGLPLTTLSLLAATQADRVRIVREITEFLLRNPGIDFRDFRRQQFVLSEDFLPRPLFVDFDDVAERLAADYDDTKTATQIYRSMVFEFLAVGANATQIDLLRDLDKTHSRAALSVGQLNEFLRNF